MERVFRVERAGGLQAPPQPKEGVFRKLGSFRSQLLRHLGSCRPWTMEEFIGSYRGAKQLTVRRAAESVAQRPLSERDAQLATFVKAEKLNLSKKPDPAPRVIQPRHPRYNVGVGPYIKSVEHRIYGAIARVWGGPTVMKGYNAVEVAGHIRDMWDEFARPVAVGLDASRFDQHVSLPALQWEHSVYNGVFRDKQLAKLLSWQLHNRGVAHTPDGVVRYAVDGCRMSGDMNTALGNCLLMSAMVHQYCKERGIKTRLANNGDDCVVIMERKCLARFEAGLRDWFLEWGFNIVVEEPVYDFERIQFCQTQPVWANGRWVMCRDVRVVMDKDTINLHPDNLPYDQWLTHVGTGGGALAQGVPVLQTFYEVLRGLGGPIGRAHEVTGMDMMAARMECATSPISDEARVSFFKAFGLAPWVQVQLEQELAARAGVLTMGLMTPDQVSLTPLLNIEDGWC